MAEEQIPETEEVSQEPEAEAEVQEPIAEGPESEVESEEEKLGKRRIRPRNELDQQVIDLYDSGFSGSFADASRIIYGQESSAPTQNLTPTQEVEANEPDPITDDKKPMTSEPPS